MKFNIVKEDELHGREALLQHLKNTKRPSDVVGPECPICKGWGKVFKDKERITCPKCKGTGVLKTKCPECGGVGEVYWDYNDPETESVVKAHGTCPKCKGTGVIKEQTLSGAGYPTATAGGQQAIDKMPLGFKLAKRKRRVKRIMARRIQPKL